MALLCRKLVRRLNSSQPIRAMFSISTPLFAQHKIFKMIPNNVDSTCNQYKENLARYKEVENIYKQLHAMALEGGGEKNIVRHTEHNKKALVWERLRMLFDNVDEVLELSTLAGLGLPYGNIPRAGTIVAIGKIQGVYCIVSANDATVKAGTMYPITVKKQLRAQEIAEQLHLPCIYVVDSGGAFLPLQAEIFTNGGRAFYNEAILNSKSIPQLAVVCGSCTAGAAYVPTMSQEALIVHRIGTIFLGGPPLVYAALGEVVSPEQLGGATLHSRVSGCTDHFSGTEDEAFKTSREIVATFNIDPVESPVEYSEPLYDPEELGGIIPENDQHEMDMYQVIARIVDGSGLQEFKAQYGNTLITGFAYIKRFLVGILANNGIVTQQAGLKGAHFVQMCSQRNVPLIFLQNSTPDKHADSLAEGLAIKGHAALMGSVACANVPKITVIVGNSFGVDNFLLGGRSFDPNFVFCWPNAKICMVDPSSLSQTQSSQENAVALSDTLGEQSSAFYSSARVWDDGVILPPNTRQVLGTCLEIVNQQKGVKWQHTDYGVIRM